MAWRMGTVAAVGLGMLLGACGSTKKTVVRIDDGALARLNERQMQPVDEARIEEGRARDQVARARAGIQEVKARLDVAKAERDVAVAQLNRAKAEHDMLTRQKADTKDLMRARLDAQLAIERVKAVDLKIDYLNRMIGVTELEEQVAQQHVEVTKSATERAKYQALSAAGSNEVRGLNPQEIDARFAEAQAREAQLRRAAAERRVALVDSYNRWQELDARLRTQPDQDRRPPPAPTMPSEPRR